MYKGFGGFEGGVIYSFFYSVSDLYSVSSKVILLLFCWIFDQDKAEKNYYIALGSCTYTDEILYNRWDYILNLIFP